MKKLFYKALPLLVLLCFFTLVSMFYYSGIGKVYFQQDEWYKTGKSIYYLYSDFGNLWTKKFAFHYYPLLNLFFMAEYLVFKMHVSYYLYFGVILQSVAALFFYLLTKRLFGKRIIAFLLSFLFLVNPGIHQVMLNEMVSLYKIVLILMLIVFIFLYDQISKGKEIKTKTIVFLSIFYAVSTFVFESMLILLVLTPIFYILFKSRKTFIMLSKKNISILVGTVLFTVLRLLLQSRILADAPLPVQGSFLVSSFYNAVTTPYKFLVEYLFGLHTILYFAEIYSLKIFYFLHEPGISLNIVTITTGYEVLVYFLIGAILIVTSVILVLTHSQGKIYKRSMSILVFTFFWLVLNSVAIAPQGRIFTSVESRYLYISGVGVLWFLGVLVLIVWDKYKRNLAMRAGIACFVLIYLFAWSIYSYYMITIEKQAVINVSLAREKVINQFKTLYPQLPDTSVFYVYCSDDCTSNLSYGMPKDWVVPFQNGLGWVLLSIYSTDHPKRYAPFFSDYLFFDSKSAGYRKIGNTTFGFYTDLSALRKTMQENSLTSSDIIVLAYESKKYKLTPVKNKNKILYPELR